MTSGKIWSKYSRKSIVSLALISRLSKNPFYCHSSLFLWHVLYRFILPIFTIRTKHLLLLWKNLRDTLWLTILRSRKCCTWKQILESSDISISRLEWAKSNSPMRSYQRHNIFMGRLRWARQTSLNVNYFCTLKKQKHSCIYRII